MGLATLAYVWVELAFNHALVFTLGSVDLAADGMTERSVLGIAVMGRRLTATAVSLALAGSFAASFAKRTSPWPFGVRAMFDRNASPEPKRWHMGYWAYCLLFLAAVWTTIYHAEHALFEAQANSAPPVQMQNLHIALNGSKAALAAATEAHRNPGGLVQPVTLDVSDTCLAVVGSPRAHAVRLDYAFLSQPGARPLAAALPHLLAARWDANDIAVAKEHCEIVDRWSHMLPSSGELYETMVSPFMRRAEEAFHRNGPFESLPAPPNATVDAPRLTPSAASLRTGGRTVAELLDQCMTPDAPVDFVGVQCMWRAAQRYAAAQGQLAGGNYVAGFLTERDAFVDAKRREIDAAERRGLSLGDDFSQLTAEETAEFLTAARKTTVEDRCISALGLADEVAPKNLDDVQNCAELGQQLAHRGNSAGQSRFCSLNDGCFLSDRLKTRAAERFLEIKRANCGNRSQEETASALTAMCRAQIETTVKAKVESGRKRLNQLPREPRSGMQLALEEGLKDEQVTNPGGFPSDVQDLLREEVNRLIQADGRLRDLSGGSDLTLSSLDALPVCSDVKPWATTYAYERVSNGQAVGEALSALNWCEAYGRGVARSGARALEHTALLPSMRQKIRDAVYLQLTQYGDVAPTEGQRIAYAFVPDDWVPEKEAAFARRIEGGLLTEVVRPQFVTQLSASLAVSIDEAEHLLNQPPTTFRDMLARPFVSDFVGSTSQLTVDGAMAYAGLPASIGPRLRLTASPTPDWRVGFDRDIYQPVFQNLQGSVLDSRLAGSERDYRRSGRCFKAGVEAYRLTLLPSLGLLFSAIGLLYHFRKLLLYVLRLLPLHWAVRHLAAGIALATMVLLPTLQPPPVAQTPLALNLFQSLPAGYNRIFLPWMVSAQAKYEAISYSAYKPFARGGRWSFDDLAPKAVGWDVDPGLQKISDDTRIKDLRRVHPEIAAKFEKDRGVTEARRILSSQFLCDPAQDKRT